MKIQDVATATGKSQRTIIRWIDNFNSLNGKNLPNGVNAIFEDDELIKFIEGKSKVKIAIGAKRNIVANEKTIERSSNKVEIKAA